MNRTGIEILIVDAAPLGDTVMIGEHPVMHALRSSLERAARLSAPVLLEGATGTGKEVAVETLHGRSGRRGRLVAVNVAALPEHLIESELFGSTRGAFTGSVADRAGLLEEAGEGTLYLDEAAELPLSLQVKLLRVLENGVIRRVGGTKDWQVPFRLVLSTQESPADLVESGKWRADFYYRVASIGIRVPSLAEHVSDVPLLINHFLGMHGRPPLPFTDGASALLRYHWPGNVREVKRTVERAVFHAGSEPVTEALLIGSLTSWSALGSSSHERRSGGRALRDIERDHIETVLRETGYDATAAAEILGLSSRALYRRFRLLGIRPPRKRARAV